MTGGLLALAINVVVSGLFAAVFLLIARSHPAFRHLGWIAAAWGVGTGAPAAEVLLRVTPWTTVLSFTGYACFSAGAHLLAHGLARHYRRTLPRWLLPASFAASLIIRLAIWGGERNTMPYELYYQLPFVTALAISGVIVWPARRRSVWDAILAGCLWLFTLTFASKPVAAILLGSGATARDYASSHYAIYSQAASGLIALGCGIALMAVVIRDLRVRLKRDLVTDAPTGLPNRRGFLAGLQTRMDTAPAGDLLIVCETGWQAAPHDRITALRRALPPTALLGRIDPQRLAVLLPGETDPDRSAIVRGMIRDLSGAGHDGSLGEVRLAAGEDAAAALARAEGSLFLDAELRKGRRGPSPQP